MMNHHRLTQLLAALTAALSLLGYSALLSPIDTLRSESNANRPATEQLPTGHALPWHMTLARTSLGPFRALAVNFLWYRADQLSQENRLFEASQLSQWIASLMPQYPRVWSFHAWNLVYNISVRTYTPQERWDWINKGVTLLRDKGIPCNPNSPRLYHELSWIFFHKLGRESDDMHWYYKRQFALQWQELLGQPPAGTSTQQALDTFRKIAQAPDSLQALLALNSQGPPSAQTPPTRPPVQSLIDGLHKMGYQLDEVLLRQLGRAEMFVNDPRVRRAFSKPSPNGPPLPYDTNLAPFFENPATGPSLDALTAFLRKKVLRNTYHMDPAFMLQLMELYGPLDWRHPVSHGLYWSEMGLAKSGQARDWAQDALQFTAVSNPAQSPKPAHPPETSDSPDSPEDPDSLHDGHDSTPDHNHASPDMDNVDLLNTNRLAIHALQQLTRMGQVSFDPLTLQIDLLPDVRFIPAYDLAMDQAKQRIESGQYGHVSTASFETGHENFLLQAMKFCYLYGDTPSARRYYKKARELYASKPENAASGRYKKPLIEQVGLQIRQDLGAMADTNQFIRAMLLHAFKDGLAQNRLEVFNRYVKVASRAHRQYQAEQAAQPHLNQDRSKLLDFPQIVDETYILYMSSSRSLQDLLKRARAWVNTPILIKQRVADRLLPVLAPQAQQIGLDPDRAFPPPPPPSGTLLQQLETPPEEFNVEIERK